MQWKRNADDALANGRKVPNDGKFVKNDAASYQSTRLWIVRFLYGVCGWQHVRLTLKLSPVRTTAAKTVKRECFVGVWGWSHSGKGAVFQVLLEFLLNGGAIATPWISEIPSFLRLLKSDRCGGKDWGAGVTPSGGCCPGLLFFWGVIFSSAELAAGRENTGNDIRRGKRSKYL